MFHKQYKLAFRLPLPWGYTRVRWTVPVVISGSLDANSGGLLCHTSYSISAKVCKAAPAYRLCSGTDTVLRLWPNSSWGRRRHSVPFCNDSRPVSPLSLHNSNNTIMNSRKYITLWKSLASAENFSILWVQDKRSGAMRVWQECDGQSSIEQAFGMGRLWIRW